MELLANRGEISAQHFVQCDRTCEIIGDKFGRDLTVETLMPDHFKNLYRSFAFDGFGKKYSPHVVKTHILRTRCMFKFAFDEALIASPVRYGQSFKIPSKKTMRIHRNKQPKKYFSEAEILDLIKATKSPHVRAMIWLGANCGFNNSDCCRLEFRHLDMKPGRRTLKSGWVDYPRGKSGIPREAVLWPETIKAIQESIKLRRKSKNKTNVFLTSKGAPWRSVVLCHEFADLKSSLKIKRRGAGFGSLRHVFATVAGHTLDQVVVDRIMGHSDESMPAVYRESIERSRYQRVADHVRAWLLEPTETAAE